MNDGPGRTLALVGTALFGAGILIATLAAFVVLFRLKRPGTDAVARRVLLAGGAIGAIGLALFAWSLSRWGS